MAVMFLINYFHNKTPFNVLMGETKEVT